MPHFIVRGRNEKFRCEQCGTDVVPHTSSVRNHCPRCLWSKHVDDVSPGDRASDCDGMMEPVGVEQRGRSGSWRLVHQCRRCGQEQPCAAAPDDDVERLLAVARDRAAR